MRKKIKLRRKQGEPLKPINSDARAFLRPWATTGKVPLERGRFLCKSCGADFENQPSLAYHCATEHRSLYPELANESADLKHFRCLICGLEMDDTPGMRKEHIAFHGGQEITNYCKQNGLPNPFEKF
jgi:hypothetical protein